MASAPKSANVIRFGLFEVDLQARELRKSGVKLKIHEQPLQVLIALLERPGEVVAREELRRKLWQTETFVEFDHSINTAVNKLREALGDSADNPRFVETLARRGYRFVAPVNGTASKASATAQRKWRRPWVLSFAFFLLLVSIGIGLRFTRPASHSEWRMVPFTSFTGHQADPAFSPDGKQVAFAWDGEKGDNFDIYVKLVDAGAPLRLTTNPAADSAPAWSPDGRYIAFCRESSDHFEVWMIPALGGAERRLTESADCDELSWSPDGKFLALVDKSSPTSRSIFLLSIETGEKRKLTSPPATILGDFTPRFSPDGKTLAFQRNTWFATGGLYLQPLGPGTTPVGPPRRLTSDGRQVGGIGGLDWTADGRSIVFSSGYPLMVLWTIPAAGGMPERLAIAGENATGLSTSRKGDRLIYVRNSLDFNIWRIPGPSWHERKSAPTRLIATTQPDIEPQFSPDGKKIAFTSARSGNPEIWICNSDTSDPAQLTAFGAVLGSPRWSPDGQWIAFDGTKAGNYDIYVISANGGQPRRLTAGPSNNIRPSWSKDGRWVYFGSNRKGGSQVWRAPAQGGAALQVTKWGGTEAFESFDGKSIYYAKSDVSGIWKVAAEGGEETRVFAQGQQSLWALTAQGIYFFDGGGLLPNAQGGALTLKFYSFATGKVALLREFPKDTRVDTTSTALSVSADGRWILYTQLDQDSSDLMLVENYR